MRSEREKRRRDNSQSDRKFGYSAVGIGVIPTLHRLYKMIDKLNV
jgi:hypothetical protein